MTDLPTYVLERTFNAPRNLVWKTWTDATLLPRWYGPNVESIVHRLDVTPGGLWLNEMRKGEWSHFERVEYLEVDAPSRLVWLHSVANADWEIAPNPMMPDWPKALLTTVTFEEVGERTNLRLIWAPHNASDAEIACFAGAMAGLDKGWGSGMDVLEQLLAELQT